MLKTLGNRMKEYEAVTDISLIKNMPVMIRLDGRAFHSFTKGFEKPFSDLFNECMEYTMLELCNNLSNCLFGYTQSDEITIILYDKKQESDAFFDNRLQKIVSISASMATLFFNKKFCELYKENDKKLFKATFDSRAFNIPKEDVVNNIIWRQNDATKNSINAVAQANFSHKELQGKNCSQMQDMLMLLKKINWNNIPTKYKRGSCCYKKEVEVDTPNGKVIRNRWIVDCEMPILSQNKDFLENIITKD